MENSHIQWTDHTFNPWEGCTKVSPGCANCYAEARNKRWNKGANWGKGAPRRRTSEANWKQPLKWNREAQRIVEQSVHDDIGPMHYRPRVFCASLADWLDDEVPIRWLGDLIYLIRNTPNLDWLLLTKRPENFEKRLSQVAFTEEWLKGKPYSNVWIGTTVEDQARADERIPMLLQIPAKIHFLSCEPLLENVDLGLIELLNDAQDGSPMIQWVICGGESGQKARPFNIEWARGLKGQCEAAGVAFFMKQLGSNPRQHCWDQSNTSSAIFLKDRSGGDCDEWPKDLRIRQFPKENSHS